uniref:Ig-like domain-containing protein n=1 Tax=Anolis carolinensis TaxID=28377 RepID=H9GBC8_ANOCA
SAMTLPRGRCPDVLMFLPSLWEAFLMSSHGPKMRITSDYKAPSHNTLLICFVDSFFPAKIKIRWLRNGKEEKGDQVMTSGLIDNGDWTYQMHEMLETQPERGDVYACQVEHDSFASPASIEWRPQSDAAKSKMWTGVVGLVLGVVFVAAGLSLYVKKGEAHVCMCIWWECVGTEGLHSHIILPEGECGPWCPSVLDCSSQHPPPQTLLGSLSGD